MNRLHEFLKVKHISLAEEKKAINRLIRRHRKSLRRTGVPSSSATNLTKANYLERVYTCDDLYRHGKDVVSKECRATHLALAYLKGYSYEHIERSVKHFTYGVDRTGKVVYYTGDVDLWNRVARIVAKYSNAGNYYAEPVKEREEYQKYLNSIKDDLRVWREKHEFYTTRKA